MIYIIMKGDREVIRISGDELSLVHVQAIANQHYGADASVSLMNGNLVKESSNGVETDRDRTAEATSNS